MDRPLEIRDVENISLEASDENSGMDPQLVAQFTDVTQTVTALVYKCITRIYYVVWMTNVMHAAIQGIRVTVKTPNVSGVITQQCSHLHLQSITSIQEQDNNNVLNSVTLMNEYGILAYESNDVEMDSLEVSNFTHGVLLYKAKNTSIYDECICTQWV